MLDTLRFNFLILLKEITLLAFFLFALITLLAFFLIALIPIKLDCAFI